MWERALLSPDALDPGYIALESSVASPGSYCFQHLHHPCEVLTSQ